MNKFTPRETSPRSATAEPRPRPLRAEQLVAFEVAIKLCYADWQTLTSQMQLGAPTDDAAMLAAGAATLIQRHWQRTRAVRLIGVRAGRLTGANRPAQLTLSYERPPERLAADEGGGDPRDSP